MLNIRILGIFSENRAVSLFYPYSALTSCKKSEKSLEPFSRKLVTNGRTDGLTDGRTTGAISKDPVGNFRGPKSEKSLEPFTRTFGDTSRNCITNYGQGRFLRTSSETSGVQNQKNHLSPFQELLVTDKTEPELGNQLL